jgi:hypothetical protein
VTRSSRRFHRRTTSAGRRALRRPLPRLGPVTSAGVLQKVPQAATPRCPGQGYCEPSMQIEEVRSVCAFTDFSELRQIRTGAPSPKIDQERELENAKVFHWCYVRRRAVAFFGKSK